MDTERKRKPRFSNSDVDILIQKVNEKSVILFSKFSDQVTNKRKKEAWVEVQNAVNATSIVPRSMEEIKKKWDDVKRVTKKRATDVRRDMRQTGGGERSHDPLTDTEDMVISLIGEDKIYGIPDGMDSFPQRQEATGCNIGESSGFGSTLQLPSTSNFQMPSIPNFQMPSTSNFQMPSTSTFQGANMPAFQMPCTPTVEIQRPSTVEQIQTTSFYVSNAGDNSKGLKNNVDMGESLQFELLRVEKERLDIERKRFMIEVDRLEIEKARLNELKKISGIIYELKTQKPNSDTDSMHLDKQDYSYLYATLS